MWDADAEGARTSDVYSVGVESLVDAHHRVGAGAMKRTSKADRARHDRQHIRQFQ
jgi:hypothetical protein